MMNKSERDGYRKSAVKAAREGGVPGGWDLMLLHCLDDLDQTHFERWRDDAPTEEEVRRQTYWWYFCHDEEDGDPPQVLELHIYGDDARIATHSKGEDVRSWRGWWAPCMPPERRPPIVR